MNRQQLATALDLDVRTLHRLLGRGLPLPADGESLPQWVVRATAWRAENKKPPGPKPGPAREERDRLELAILGEKLAKLQHENKVERGDTHSRKQCEAEQDRKLQIVAAAFLSLGARVARKCYQAASPDVIQGIIHDEARRLLEILSGSGADSSVIPDLAGGDGGDPATGDSPRADAS